MARTVVCVTMHGGDDKLGVEGWYASLCSACKAAPDVIANKLAAVGKYLMELCEESQGILRSGIGLLQ